MIYGYYKHRVKFRDNLEYVLVDEKNDLMIGYYSDGTTKTKNGMAHVKDFIYERKWVPYTKYLYDIDDLLEFSLSEK